MSRLYLGGEYTHTRYICPTSHKCVLVWIGNVVFLLYPNSPWDTLGKKGHSQGQPLFTASVEQLGLRALIKGTRQIFHLVRFEPAAFQLLDQCSYLEAICRVCVHLFSIHVSLCVITFTYFLVQYICSRQLDIMIVQGYTCFMDATFKASVA